MRPIIAHSNASTFATTRATAALICGLLLAIAVAQSAVAQAPASEQPASAPPATATAPSPQNETPAAQPPSSGSQNSTAPATPAPKDSADSDSARAQAGGVTEDQLRQMFAGKTLYLRGGYLDNALTFDEHGKLIGHSPQGSYTLSLFMVDKVQLSKHKVELTGSRYGLHFLGALPNEDPTKAVDRVKITPKKKFVRITIDRELVVTPKKKKEKKGAAPAKPALVAAPNSAPAATANAAPPAAAPAAEAAATVEQSDVDAAKAEMAAAPEAERPADAASVTTTTSPAHAAQVLRDALDKIFAPSLDQRMIDGLPSFWKLYYQAAATQSDYKPRDPGVYHQREVDQRAKLTSTFEPPSNEYAQSCGVAGMAMYHAVIGADGKPQEIVVGRPIGFGLDESAAETIRKATFQPAIKDGKPVPIVLDLVVQFRIYSKRTDQAAKSDSDEAAAAPKLPGPYSVGHP